MVQRHYTHSGKAEKMVEKITDDYIDVMFDGCNCIWHGPSSKLIDNKCPLHSTFVKTVIGSETDDGTPYGYFSECYSD